MANTPDTAASTEPVPSTGEGAVTINNAELRTIYGRTIEHWDTVSRRLEARAAADREHDASHYDQLRRAHAVNRERLERSIRELDAELTTLDPEEQTRRIAEIQALVNGAANGQALADSVRDTGHAALDMFRGCFREMGELVDGLGGDDNDGRGDNGGRLRNRGFSLNIGGIIGGGLGLGLAWLLTTLFGGGIIGMLAFALLAIPFVIMGCEQMGPGISDFLGLDGGGSEQQRGDESPSREVASNGPETRVHANNINRDLYDIFANPSRTSIGAALDVSEMPTPWPGGIAPTAAASATSLAVIPQ